MNKATLLALGAIPGLVFCYAVLTGILVKKVTPVPIVKMDRRPAPTALKRPSRYQPTPV